MEVRRSKGLVEPISEEHKIEWSSEADDYAPMQGSLVRLSGLPTETNQEMIKEVLLRLSAPVYFVDVYPDNTALIRLCHDNGAKLLLAKLKNGKVRIGKKSVLVSSLDEGEDDWSLPKTQDETHHFWKSCKHQFNIFLIFILIINHFCIYSGNCKSQGAQLLLARILFPKRT